MREINIFRVQRAEEGNFEKDVLRSEDEPKLFYKYINGRGKKAEDTAGWFSPLCAAALTRYPPSVLDY
ncbi:hypothetical protein E2C01_057939 [Portunus trituberculatus]|uniref:Uncharacterized protein n=1 Tax=Portunus trituberculatus TaxID=210409 RepID=A0A5B7H1B8_PORTR|nr:hypothetical protein [Portunus trituberculatus]